jgi:hypothetical protein
MNTRLLFEGNFDCVTLFGKHEILHFNLIFTSTFGT